MTNSSSQNDAKTFLAILGAIWLVFCVPAIMVGAAWGMYKIFYLFMLIGSWIMFG